MIVSNLERRNRRTAAFNRDTGKSTRLTPKREANRRTRFDHRRDLRDPRTW